MYSIKRKMRLLFCSRRFLISITVLFLVVITINVFWFRMKVLVRDIGYLTRPMWDKPHQRPTIVIPHFHAENMTPKDLCGLHNWTLRDNSKIPTVIDAVIFNGEVDMLEIRMKELWTVVDKFIVIEANLTFTGNPKPLFLMMGMEQFKWADEKLSYHKCFDLTNTLPEGENPFYNEIRMRSCMGSALSSDEEIRLGDIIIQSDLDEIPSAKSIGLLKSCKGYPDGLHLEMKTYLYSFEFYLDRDNWKPHISLYRDYYHHGWSSNYVLADAGWHCSFCFRYISQFIFKMLAYSHTDRVTNDKLLVKENIQVKICRGADIFDMFPESYTYKDLISKMGDIPRTHSAVDIPDYIVQNPEKFKYLLPGGCRREDVVL